MNRIAVSFARLLAAIVLCLSTSSPAWSETEVTACGQAYQGSGFLAGDLDCTGTGIAAVRIAPPGSLDLRGHTLTGDIGVERSGLDRSGTKIFSSVPGGAIVGTGAAGGLGIQTVNLKLADVSVSGFEICVRTGERTRITNSTITGCSVAGVRVTVTDSLLTVSSSDISFNGGWGISAPRVSLRDSNVSNNGSFGVSGGGKSKVRRSTISENAGVGFDGSQLKIRSAIISGNADHGIIARTRLVLVDSDVSGNGGSGVDRFNNARIRSSVLSGNAVAGVSMIAPPFQDTDVGLVITQSTLVGNGNYGVLLSPPGSPASLRGSGSTLTGNGTGVDCGVTFACADVATPALPGLAASVVCDTSYQVGSGIPGASWGVCALD